MLALYLSLAWSITFYEGNIAFHKVTVSPDSPYMIYSPHKYMCVLFFTPSEIYADVYQDNSLFISNIDLRKHTGVDFGEHSGKILFKTRIPNSVIHYSVIVFPRPCRHHRLVSTDPYFKLVFSDQSSDPDYRIRDKQKFCFWPALPISHSIEVETYVEDKFDHLLFHSNAGVHDRITGITKKKFQSDVGVEFFIWKTDDSGLSHNFSIKIFAMKKYHGPIFSNMLRGREARDITLIYNDDPPDKDMMKEREEDKKRDFRMRNLLITLSVVTVAMVIAATYSVCVCVKIFKHRFRNDDEPDGINLGKSDYYNANDDSLPQPITHAVL